MTNQPIRSGAVDSQFYAGFQHGEWGDQSSYSVGFGLFRLHLYYQGFWSGQNCWRYIDGSVGPRPGLADVTPANMAASPSDSATQYLCGLGYAQLQLSSQVWYAVNSPAGNGAGASVVFYSLNPTQNANAVPVTQPVIPTTANGKPVGWHPSGFVSVQSAGTYTFNAFTNTIAAIASAPGGSLLDFYSNCMIVAGQAPPLQNRIDYSAAVSAAGVYDWTPGNGTGFVTLGQGQITGIFPQRTHMVITTRNGGVYIWSGTPGLNDTIRRGVATDAPWDFGWGGIDGNGLVWYLANAGDSPRTFNGTQMGAIPYLHATGRTVTLGPISLGPQNVAVSRVGIRPEEMILGNGQQALMFTHGCWTTQRFATSDPHLFAAPDTAKGILYLATQAQDANGVPTAPPKIFALNTEAQGPGILGGSMQAPGDASPNSLTGTVILPEYSDRAGSKLVVRMVLVDFKAFNTGSPTPNTLDVTATAVRRYNTQGGVPMRTLSVDPLLVAGPATVGDSVQGRCEFHFGDITGNGYQLSFNLRGVALQKVTVVCVQEPVTV